MHTDDGFYLDDGRTEPRRTAWRRGDRVAWTIGGAKLAGEIADVTDFDDGRQVAHIRKNDGHATRLSIAGWLLEETD